MKSIIKEFKNKEEMLNYPLIKEAFENVIDMNKEDIDNMEFIDNKLKSENDYLWVEEYHEDNAEFIVVNNEIIYSNNYINIDDFIEE
jgi:hypothetical protein